MIRSPLLRVVFRIHYRYRHATLIRINAPFKIVTEELRHQEYSLLDPH